MLLGTGYLNLSDFTQLFYVACDVVDQKFRRAHLGNSLSPSLVTTQVTLVVFIQQMVGLVWGVQDGLTPTP